MFTFLDAVNQYLGYINFSPKLKNQIYTVVGGVATAYMIYAGIRFLINGVVLQGILFLIVGLLMLYFLFLNVVYFFTKYKAPFDISPKIEKLFRIKPRQPQAGVSTKPVIDDIQNPLNIPMDGFYDPKHVLPARVVSNASDLKNINMIAHDMLTNSLMTDNYAGLTEQELSNYLSRSRKPAYAICAGALVPHFSLKRVGQKYVAYAGINQAHLLQVGTVVRVGLQSARNLNPDRIQLFAASAILVGGNYKTSGRSGTIDQKQGYQIQMRIAFNQ